MNITLRQIINNHPMVKRINSSALGKKFQNSAFARNVEATIYLIGNGVSQSVADGDGIFAGIRDALEPTRPGMQCGYGHDRSYVVQNLEGTRPDLNGTIDPRNYVMAQFDQRRGIPMDKILSMYAPRKLPSQEMLNAPVA